MQEFASDLISASKTSLEADTRETAVRGLVPWLDVYAKRAQLPAEVDAWTSTELSLAEDDIRLYGEWSTDGEWEGKREAAVKRINPRFVLRQWVLEETIAELERTGVEGIQEGRRTLARILDVNESILRP